MDSGDYHLVMNGDSLTPGQNLMMFRLFGRIPERTHLTIDTPYYNKKKLSNKKLESKMGFKNL